MNVRAFACFALAVLGVAASAAQQGPAERPAARAGDLDAFYRSLPAAKTAATGASRVRTRAAAGMERRGTKNLG